MRYLYKKRQMENLERMGENYLSYGDEAEVFEEPEVNLGELDQLIVDEVERQLTPERVLHSVKDEL